MVAAEADAILFFASTCGRVARAQVRHQNGATKIFESTQKVDAECLGNTIIDPALAQDEQMRSGSHSEVDAAAAAAEADMIVEQQLRRTRSGFSSFMKPMQIGEQLHRALDC